MRNFFRYIALLAAVFTAFSCSKEDMQQPDVQEDVQVKFAVQVPSDLTKAIGEGVLATNLDFAVYRNEAYTSPDGTVYPAGEYLKNASDASNSTVTKTGNGEWEVVLTLVKNMKYDVVFWAYADNAPYTFNKEQACITVDDYTGAANSDVRDAFYKCVTGYMAVDKPVDVDLTRPFAQINWGSDDYSYITDLGISMTSKIDTRAHADVSPAIASVTVPNTLNVLDGSVSGEEVIDFTLAAIPADNGNAKDKVLVNYKGVDYTWVSMNYILAGAEKTLGNIRATFSYNGYDLTIDVNNVPYKRNYKTNILGSLFTESSKFEVVIVPNFSGETQKEINN